jgi:hypothetical protein
LNDLNSFHSLFKRLSEIRIIAKTACTEHVLQARHRSAFSIFVSCSQNEQTHLGLLSSYDLGRFFSDQVHMRFERRFKYIPSKYTIHR